MQERKFNEDMLIAFIREFYGYGNWGGDYWFVGLEQGGGNSYDEIQKRLEVWDSNGRPSLENAATYHRAIGLDHFFDVEKTKLQSTWARLIRTILGYEGKSSDNTKIKEVKEYQLNHFLRDTSNSCSIELLPLPSPSMNKWIYKNHSDLPYLESRYIYREKFASDRANTIKQRILEHQPKFVMFYGIHPEYVAWWEYIAGRTFTTIQITPKFSADFLKSNSTIFVISRHPVAHGTTNEYWHQLGETISKF